MHEVQRGSSISPVPVVGWPLLLWLGRVGHTRQNVAAPHAACIGRLGGNGPINGGDHATPCQTASKSLKLSGSPSRVLEPYRILVDVFLSNPPDPLMDARRQMIEPYLIRSEFYYASQIKSF
ncbi:hypothetical protein PIB30_097876 [Stylosanthes scabra]|uniref:Uncharacterized protein n=1 Tax=Stylosanthes scabra TaxID=79078 RepID=A0ABU6XY15_9FABA|nr:hypothetical protein [Stylosanthes scabra]